MWQVNAAHWNLKVIEYGKENAPVVMLLHGGGLSWWNYREEALLLAETYHVVLPVLDGHADSAAPFTTIEENARRLIRYIDEDLGGAVLAIGGLSLGGQILVEMLSQRDGICQYAVIESALTLPMALTHALIAPTFGMCYGLVKKRWFSKLQFKTLKIRQDLFEDYYRDTCKMEKQSLIRVLQSNSSYRLKPGLANTTAKALILVGAREQKKMRRSAEMLHGIVRDSQLKILDHLGHGECSLNHPGDYVKLLEGLISAPD